MTTSDGLDPTDKQIALGKLYELALMDRAKPLVACNYFWESQKMGYPRFHRLPVHYYAIINPKHDINICVIQFPAHHKMYTRYNLNGISEAARLIDRYFSYLLD